MKVVFIALICSISAGKLYSSGTIKQHVEERSFFYIGASTGIGIATNFGDDPSFGEAPNRVEAPSTATMYSRSTGMINNILQLNFLFLFNQDKKWGVNLHMGFSSETVQHNYSGEISSDEFATMTYRGDIGLGVYYRFLSLGLEYSIPLAGFIDSEQIMDRVLVDRTALVSQIFIPVYEKGNKQRISIFIQGKYSLSSVFSEEVHDDFYKDGKGSYRPASVHIGVNAMINVLRYYN